MLLAATLSSLAHAANLPTGGVITAGTGTISQAGNTLTITQATDKMAADWQSFSIGQGYRVNFVQPSSSAIALNRVLGTEPSVIQGALTANGQVFLINPNGVLFTPSAQVDVGGLVASTQNLSNADFLAGRLRLTGTSDAAIRNEGAIKVGAGGTAAFIAARIENTGTIDAPRGNVLLGAGKTVTLDLGGPVKIQVEEGALDALIAQGGAIRADGGLVYLTAKAADELSSAVINHSGITEARTLATGEDGAIYLMGDMARGQVNVAGTLDASPLAGADSGAQGGFVETSAAKVQVQEGAQVKAGHWLIDPNDFTIAASGGDITGSAVSTALASGDVTIQTTATTPSCTGVTGCGSGTNGNGDIFVMDNITWSSGKKLTLSAYRNIEILATIDASGGSGGKVVLEYGQGASNGIIGGQEATYRFGLTPSGFTGKINLQAGNNFSTKLGSSGSVINYTVITQLGIAGDESSGPANSLQGLANSSRVSGNYALGADIDASATSGWNGGAGFVPIGNSSTKFTGRFDGLGHSISGLTIERSSTDYVGLFGLAQSGARIQNVGLAGGGVRGGRYVGGLVGMMNVDNTVSDSYATGEVRGNDLVGGLVGHNYNSTVSGSYATGAVRGNDLVGGLVGGNSYGTVSGSYATGEVRGGSRVGGLVGSNSYGTVSGSYATGEVRGNGLVGGLVGGNSDGTVSGSYATGAASGNDLVGGLVGGNSYGTVSDSYATGAVRGIDFIGGLVGANVDSTVRNSYATGPVRGTTNVGGLLGAHAGTVTASFWDTETSGQSASAGGTGKTTSEMKQLSTYTGWDIDDAGGTGTVWRIYDGQTYPLLRGFLAPLTVTAKSGSRPYNGTTNGLGVTYSTTTNANLLGTATVTADAKDVGSRTLTVSGLYSNQWGFDISYATGTLTITPRPVDLVGNRVYDGTTDVAAGIFTLNNLVSGEDLGLTGSGTVADKNVGAGKTVTLGSLALADGNNGLASNYTLSGGTHTANITPKALNVSGITANSKTYDGTTAATLNYSNSNFTGLITGDTLTASGAFADKNVGTGKTVNLTFGGADVGNYTISGQSSATADITPRPVTVTADAKSKPQGQPDPALTYTTGCGTASSDCGLVAGETLTGSLTRDAGEAVGNYAIQQGTVTDANNPNYAITYVGADLTITATGGGSSGDPDFVAAITSVQSGTAGEAPQLLPDGQQSSGFAGTGVGPVKGGDTQLLPVGHRRSGAGGLVVVRVECSGIRLPGHVLLDGNQGDWHYCADSR